MTSGKAWGVLHAGAAPMRRHRPKMRRERPQREYASTPHLLEGPARGAPGGPRGEVAARRSRRARVTDLLAVLLIASLILAVLVAVMLAGV
jgi:hypothetical protein